MTTQRQKDGRMEMENLIDEIGSCDCSVISDQDCLTLNQMKNILATLPAGIGIVSSGTLVWANENLYAMLGYEFGTLKGIDLRAFFASKSDFYRARRQLSSGMEKFGIALLETCLARKDGTVMDCRVRASLLDPRSPEKGTVLIVTDISEIKSLQIQLQQAQKMEAIGVLAGGISHDFNNILMGIQGHLSLMRIDLTATEKIASHIHQIKELVGTAAELTNRLLGFARGGKYQIIPLDVNNVVSIALDIFGSTRKDMDLSKSLEKGLATIEGDQAQLEQVCLNLLLNASEAIADHGKIFVSTRNFTVPENHDYPFTVEPGDYIRISIKDTGVGMGREIQKKIFDPFFSTKEVGDKKGRGLGLSTVFGIIKNHGGFITVDSELGRGSIFHVCLPALPGAGPGELLNTRELDPGIKGTETILVVDEKENGFIQGKKFLVEHGYNVITARDGMEALKIFSMYGDEILLVALDVPMMKMDFTQLAAEIKRMRKDVKILLAAGHSREEQKMSEEKYHGLIRKPYSMFEFSRTLRQTLDQ